MYYLETLAPQLLEKPESGDEVEREVLKELRKILNDDEWNSLPSLIRERRKGKLREIEQKRLRWEAERKAREQELERKRREQLIAEQRARQARIEAEQKRQKEAKRKERERKEKDIAFAKIMECLKDNFLCSDDFYKDRYSAAISRDEYENVKIGFIKSWLKENELPELDDEQAAAISTYGKHVQVIARAGSGKTTTLVLRAIFLQKHCGIPPSQIILLAFNRKAAEEINERLEKYFGDNAPYVMTFHALAYALVHPEENLLYDDPASKHLAKSRSLQSVIDDCLRDPRFKEKIRSLMLEHYRADWERIVLGGYDREKADLMQYRRSLPKVSLRGEYLKSYGEKLIADFLFEHDIPYKYERNCWWNGINYRPDFTIFQSANSGVVVEYFGLLGDPDYDEQMQEKRNFWRGNPSWRLLEIVPRNVSLGRDQFFSSFRDILERYNIKCTPLTEDEIWDRIKDRAIDRFTTTSIGFIQRCRKLSLDSPQLVELIDSRSDLAPVESQFLEIAQHLYAAYLDRLEATGEEDFDGLMQRAAENIKEGQTIFERKSGKGDLKDIRYMCIDEYQDFSALFLRLVNAIREQKDSIEFFCVGDDWQAINGFAGSDLKFYKNFHRHFSPTCKLPISTNYRSAKSIVQLGNALMYGLGEPAKPYRSDSGTVLIGNLEAFTPTNRENERHAGDEITPAVLRLVSKWLSTDRDIVLLCRKNSLPWYIEYGAIQTRKRSGLDAFCDLIRSYFPEEVRGRITTSTAHKYKGLQNDVVIVVDAVLRSYPLIHPDWVFTRVLGDDLEKINDEERRLFYVALTRAVDTLIILTEEQSISPFLQDITTRLSLDRIAWDSLTPVKEENPRLNVRVGNLNSQNNGATYAIRDQLKASGYRWDSTNKVWQKSFLEEGFTLDNLKNSIWAPVANQIRVDIVDDHESLVGKYAIHSGQWLSLENA